jgi:uncharacterized protein YyaL (SSP411 family)
MENLPDDLRRRCRSVLESLLKDLLTSPMFDPLDGGVFNARRGVSWSYPGFYRDCSSQSRAVVSLLNAYEATGESRALEKALGVLAFIESNYRTSEGLYTLGSGVSGDARKWLWWIEEVKELLTAEELAVWLPASGMKNAGNLPSEVDPLREHFRGNSIAFAKSAEEIALERGQDPSEVEQLLDTAREKLLAARDQRLGKPSGGNEANAVATFRMISAYATAYRVTGETSYRDLAKDLLDKARAHFSDGPRLRNYAGDFADSLTGGRAFLYGVAIQAAVELHHERGTEYILDEVYEACLLQDNLPKEEITNAVTRIYEAFTEDELSEKISELVTPQGIRAKVDVVFQNLDQLHIACPGHTGDWYFSGNYPTLGGNKVVNKAFMNWVEGKNQRAY